MQLSSEFINTYKMKRHKAKSISSRSVVGEYRWGKNSLSWYKTVANFTNALGEYASKNSKVKRSIWVRVLKNIYDAIFNEKLIVSYQALTNPNNPKSSEVQVTDISNRTGYNEQNMLTYYGMVVVAFLRSQGGEMKRQEDDLDFAELPFIVNARRTSRKLWSRRVYKRIDAVIRQQELVLG